MTLDDLMNEEEILRELMKEDPGLVDIFELNLDEFFQADYEGCYPEKDIMRKKNFGTCLLRDKDAYKIKFLREMAKRFEQYGKVKKVLSSDLYGKKDEDENQGK